jgi:transketolase
MEAADVLAQQGLPARVADLYSVKPIDADTLVRSARATGGRLVVVEDHYPEGGIGEAVMEALTEAGGSFKFAHLAVRSLPGSGRAAELMEAAGISAEQVVAVARTLLEESV